MITLTFKVDNKKYSPVKNFRYTKITKFHNAMSSEEDILC